MFLSLLFLPFYYVIIQILQPVGVWGKSGMEVKKKHLSPDTTTILFNCKNYEHNNTVSYF
jgi:hypothetical protein